MSNFFTGKEDIEQIIANASRSDKLFKKGMLQIINPENINRWISCTNIIV